MNVVLKKKETHFGNFLKSIYLWITGTVNGQKKAKEYCKIDWKEFEDDFWLTLFFTFVGDFVEDDNNASSDKEKNLENLKKMMEDMKSKYETLRKITTTYIKEVFRIIRSLYNLPMFLLDMAQTLYLKPK